MTITDYLLNIGLLALVVFQIRGHRITAMRLLVPVVATVWAATQFLHAVPTAGDDLVLEVGLAVTGCALGILAGLATEIRRVGSTAIARAGAIAAVLWVVGIGSRMGFYLWVSNGGQSAVERFSIVHHLTSAQAWATAFVLMALAEVLSRSGVLFVKTVRSGAVIPRGGLLRGPAAL